ncbi:S9 family peptidase [Salana multivorans]|uniref:S9 family peptidase n=1 Tax=Salana multivorans TaxID=120377 RepID=UPI000B2CDD23|nr:alpha/beta fold hydrolase [Salana multivorans]
MTESTAPADPAVPDPVSDAAPAAPTPFHSLEEYVALPRLGTLALSPDGRRLVVTQQGLDAKRTAYVTSLWEVDPTGVAPARRLTRGAKGEGGPVFTSAGDLLFVARRAEPGTAESDAKACVWRLPAAGGEAHVLARRPAGVSSVLAAEDADTVLVVADTLRGARDEADERRLRDLREDRKVAAILHSASPVRYWDSDLGPAFPRLFAVEGAPLPPAPAKDGDDAAPAPVVADPGDPDAERGTRDLTPDGLPGFEGAALAPDGSFAVVVQSVPQERAGLRDRLERIDVASGERRVLVDPGAGEGHASNPVVSPDGRWVCYVLETEPTPTTAVDQQLWVVGADGTGARRLVADWDRWPVSAAWLPDGTALLVVADDTGDAPVFRVPVTPDTTAADVERLTEDGAYSSVVVSPDGSCAYALRASYVAPNEPVRIDLATSEVTQLRSPAPSPELPGWLTEVETTVTDPDGTAVRVRGYLALPDGADEANPAPLLLWIHGGPLSSWNAWSWRWNPWLLVAKGYAVLLPDPALSTGYGRDFVQRGWGAWGSAPYTDLMALTDAVERRADVDETRTAAMGGSFGGYMANWVAGHTDRFRAIVTHASLWALDQFGPTTDVPSYWRAEVSREMAREHSPHRFVGDIVTPMLVVHGDKDYRVPIGEGLRLWYELLASSGLPADDEGRSPHRFLYFPDENHWVLTPEHAKVWYGVVSAFLAEHVLGQEEQLPEVLALGG